MRRVPEFRPPTVLAADLNALRAELMRIGGALGLSAGDGLTLADGATGRHLGLAAAPRVIEARLTGTGQEPDRTADHPLAAGTAAYSWVQVDPKPDGTFPDLAGGLAGFVDRDPAVERRKVTGLAIGTVVRLTEGPGYALADGVSSTVWAFDAPAGGGSLIGVLDGALAVGGSATMSVWAFNGTADADTGENLTVYDWLLSSGQTIAAGKKVVATFAGGRWRVSAAACP